MSDRPASAASHVRHGHNCSGHDENSTSKSGWTTRNVEVYHRFGLVGMAPAKSRYAPSGQTIATGRGLYILRVIYEYSFPFVFSPRVILSASPLEQNRILGDTNLGEVAEAAPPTSDGSESNLSSASIVSC